MEIFEKLQNLGLMTIEMHQDNPKEFDNWKF